MPQFVRPQRKPAIIHRKPRTEQQSLPKEVQERKPGEYTPTAYLYMRANEQDIGNRPMSGVFWCSPDLNLYPANAANTGIEETELKAGQTYQIECTVRNLGDLDLPMVTVDFFLTTPSLGFRVSTAEPIDLQTCSIQGGQTAKITTQLTAGTQHAGHRCLFARAYSLSPMDLPLDFDALDARSDRHVAQQNLIVVNNEESIEFQFMPLTDAEQEASDFHIEMRPVNKLPAHIITHQAVRSMRLKGSRKMPRFELEKSRNRLSRRTELSLRKKRQPGAWTGRLQGGAAAPFVLRTPKLPLRSREYKAFEVVGIDAKTNREIGSILLLIKS